MESSAGAEVFLFELKVPLRSVAIKCRTALRSEKKEFVPNESRKNTTNGLQAEKTVKTKLLFNIGNYFFY